MTTCLVPIALDVLVVREEGAAEEWARTALDVPTDAYQKTKAKKLKLLPDPFQSLYAPRQKGAYLHWAVPDALTRNRVDDQGKPVHPPEFPRLPNRWLIARLSGAPGAGERSVAAWLLPDSGARTPRVLPLGTPETPGTPAPSLTALGFGDFGWSGYYDNVLNRYAFFDDLAGVTGPVAYLVCGWHIDPREDPLAALATESDFVRRIGELRWMVDVLPAGKPYPTQSLYHAAALSIGWPAPEFSWGGEQISTEEELRPADLSGIEVSLGETLAEAVAALVTRPGAAPGLLRTVEATLKGAMVDPSNPDGPAIIETALHLSRFGSKPSGKLLFTLAMKHRNDLNNMVLSDAVRKEFANHDIFLPDDGSVRVIVEAKDLRWWIAVSDQNAYAVSKGTKKLDVSSAAHTEHIWQPAPATLDPTGARGTLAKVSRALPRVWHSLDPSVVVHGGGRSHKHGGDGRYTGSGDLVCRIEGATVTAFGIEGGTAGAGRGALPASPLGTLPGAFGIPTLAEDLLVELASLDPGCASETAVAKARATWWESFDLGATTTGLAGAHVEGALPSPVAVCTPSRPWTPLHLEWEAAYLASPRGAHDWSLASVDFTLPAQFTVPAPEAALPLKGRVLLNATPAALLDGVVAQSERTEGFSDLDFLAGTLAGISEQLRGDWLDAVIRASRDNSPELKLEAAPDTFVPLRAGFLRLDRLRLVDGFGQHLDLVGGGGDNAQLVAGSSFDVPGRDDLMALRPRFTAPARALFRFVDGGGAQVEAGPGVSPICGYLVPSLVDGTLEFFDPGGNGLGQLRPDPERGTVWEEDPGLPAAVGVRPSSVMARGAFPGRLADELLATDQMLVQARANGESGPGATNLTRLLGLLDLTRWSVDLTGRSGDEHLSLLLGHPVAVVRAVLQIDVQDPREPAANQTTAVAVKLGTLAHSQDGLLAYYVADRYDRVYVVDPALDELASAVGHDLAGFPYFDTNGVFYVNVGQPVPLTLLMMPGTDVHVTTGLLPQKKVGLMREWTAPALSVISPALRRGPILRDKSGTRLPLPADVRGSWHWHRRSDAITWVTDEVVAATSQAILPDGTVQASDGWLQVRIIPDSEYTSTPILLQITCIRGKKAKRNGLLKTTQILAVGGENGDGSPFLIPVAQAVQMQESGRFIFFVEGSVQFSELDFRSLPSLARKLKLGSDDVSAYLVTLLSGPARQALATYKGAKNDPGGFKTLLMQDLNRIITGVSLYEEARFSGVLLRPETEQMVKNEAQGSRVNRWLLEDAYRAELKTMRVYTRVIALPGGTKYLRTSMDLKGQNNLLNLPDSVY